MNRSLENIYILKPVFKSIIRIWLHFWTMGCIEFPFQLFEFFEFSFQPFNLNDTQTYKCCQRKYLLTLTVTKTRQARAINALRTIIAIDVMKPRSSSSSPSTSSVEDLDLKTSVVSPTPKASTSCRFKEPRLFI